MVISLFVMHIEAVTKVVEIFWDGSLFIQFGFLCQQINLVCFQ